MFELCKRKQSFSSSEQIRNNLNFDNDFFLVANYLIISCFANLLYNHGLFFIYYRCLATSAKLNEAPPKSNVKPPNKSFVTNFFLGRAEASETFPYPYCLTDEESETLSMVIDPIERFFAVSIKIYFNKCVQCSQCKMKGIQFQFVATF